MKLLDDLLVETVEKKKINFDPISSGVILSLARYSAGLTRINELNSEFEIKVNSKQDDQRLHKEGRFDGMPIEQFLSSGPERAVIIDLPGAGKTYALTKSGLATFDWTLS